MCDPSLYMHHPDRAQQRQAGADRSWVSRGRGTVFPWPILAMGLGRLPDHLLGSLHAHSPNSGYFSVSLKQKGREKPQGHNEYP